MKIKKSTYILWICFILLVITLTLFAKKKANNNFETFNNANINGKISKISKNKGFTDFGIYKQNKTYSFIPIESSINNNTYFPEFAIIGDSVIKPVKSDTLKLVHNGKAYFYTFEKIN